MLPETLESFVHAARAGISQSDIINADVAAEKAEAHLRNAWAFVEPTAPLTEAYQDALSAIRDYSRELGKPGAFGIRSTSLAEDQRIRALAAIETLIEALALARPNDHARMLGIDWPEVTCRG